MKGYRKLETRNGAAYVKKGIEQALAQVDTVIFDCDGVLIDTKKSYDKAVLHTAGRLTSTILGLTSDDLYSREDIYALRGTGGFNNDWDITYALVSYTVSLNQTERTEKILREVSKHDLYDRLEYISTQTTENVEYQRPDIAAFAGQLNSTGLRSLEDLYKRSGLTDFISALDGVLVYPGGVGESLVTTLFEEMFCGADLYRQIYGSTPAYLVEEKGFIENEKLIVKSATLKQLSRLTEERLGIASGSLKAQAEYILNPVLEYFRPEACIWMDNVDEEEKRTGRRDLHKPSPYSLLEAAAPLKSNRVLYVGDTRADLIMARNAADEIDVIFTGVYADAVEPEDVKTDFMEAGADLVTPSVNELTEVLEEVKR